MSPARPVLSLPKKTQDDSDLDDKPFDLAVYDLLLPCRQFVVNHKVTQSGRVPMTSEFLLRLLHSVDGMDESAVASFFGFDLRETAYVVREAEEAGHVERKEGRLWLTSTGRELFKNGSDEPQIYEVEKKTTTVGFDLLSLAPAERASLGRFELALPELNAEDIEKVSEARKLIPDAFRRFYGEIRARHGSEALKKRFLYSVDLVTPGDRFSSSVRVKVRAKAGRPGFPEPDLSGWRTGYELDDRAAVVERTASFLDGLKTFRRPTDADAYRLLLEIAPEFLQEFTRRGELNVERLFKDTLARAGELRSDRPTVPVAGSLFTEGNVARLFEALRYALELRTTRPQTSFWLVPQISAWGATSVMPTLVDQVEQLITAATGDPEQTQAPRSAAVVAGRPARHLIEAFDLVMSGDNFGPAPPLVEIFLVPHLIAAILVHAPIGAVQTFPVPLGVLSFDESVVLRAHEVFRQYANYTTVKSGTVIVPDHAEFVEKAMS